MLFMEAVQALEAQLTKAGITHFRSGRYIQARIGSQMALLSFGAFDDDESDAGDKRMQVRIDYVHVCAPKSEPKTLIHVEGVEEAITEVLERSDAFDLERVCGRELEGEEDYYVLTTFEAKYVGDGGAVVNEGS